MTPHHYATAPHGPPVERILAAGLARKFRFDADLALALVHELADRFDLAVACWDRADVAAHLRAPRPLDGAEYARVRRTPAWRQIASAAAGGSHNIAAVMAQVIAHAGLECACCAAAVTGEPAATLGHCARCRTVLGSALIRSRGCTAFGYRWHHRGQLKDPGSCELSCRDCGQPLAWMPDPECGSCHGTGRTGPGAGSCPCRTLRLRVAAAANGLGAC